MAELIYDIAVVGGGASGMMAAVEAARAGARVVLLEAQQRAGRKLLASGNGRCNLTNRLLTAQKLSWRQRESRPCLGVFIHRS